MRSDTIMVETGFGGTDGKYDAQPTHRAKDLLEVADLLPG